MLKLAIDINGASWGTKGELTKQIRKSLSAVDHVFGGELYVFSVEEMLEVLAFRWGRTHPDATAQGAAAVSRRWGPN